MCFNGDSPTVHRTEMRVASRSAEVRAARVDIHSSRIPMPPKV